MVSKMYLAMTLAMGLNNVFAEKASEPKYLWRECHTGSSRNLYDSQLEVDNVYENETIRMADYAGQVNYNYINPMPYPRTTKMLLDSIVRAKITITLKIKKFSKSFLSHIGNIK